MDAEELGMIPAAVDNPEEHFQWACLCHTLNVEEKRGKRAQTAGHEVSSAAPSAGFSTDLELLK